jgi:hypothetical protein
MSQVLFKNESDITSKWLFYVENEAKKLAQSNELLNPEVEAYLSLEEALEEEVGAQVEALSLNLAESNHARKLPDWLRPRFRRLKSKVKKVFCQVVHGMEDLNVKDIIKNVLLALIPIFAAGFPAAVLPIVIGLIAYLIKYGIEKTCPI